MDRTDDLLARRELLRSNWEGLDMSSTDQARRVPAPPLEKAPEDGAALVDLVSPAEMKIGGPSAFEAILNRKSRRKYAAAEISLEELSFLLFATQGVRKRSAAYSLRTVPSGGARHPFETYVFASRVGSLARGLYRYLPLEHKLVASRPFADGMAEELDAALNGQLWNAAACFIWTAVPYRTEWRYAQASAKIVALDAGHVCGNLYLACEAVGCGTCGIGAYRQEAMDRFLGVDGEDEFAIYAAPVGKAE